MQAPTLYISKYALTQGIFVRTNALPLRDGGIQVKNDLNYAELYHKGEWHPTLEEAQARAEVLRQEAIAALRRKIRRLEDLPSPIPLRQPPKT